MDEIELLVEHRPLAATPSPEVIRTARETLVNHMLDVTMDNDEPTVSHARPVDQKPTRRHGHRRTLIASAGAALVAAAIVVGVVPGTGPVRTPAAGALEELAHKASTRQPTGTGTVAHTVTQASYRNWAQTVDGATTTQDQTVQREAWIAPDGHGRLRETTSAGTSDTTYGQGELTATDFTNWPTTATGVLAKLRAEAAGSGMRPVDAEAFVRAGDYLRETAAPAPIRAAIFEAVAQLDGVRALGTITDHAGRAGVGFEIDSDAAHDGRWQLVFDAETTEVLGERSGSISNGYDSWTVVTTSELVESVPTGGTPSAAKPATSVTTP